MSVKAIAAHPKVAVQAVLGALEGLGMVQQKESKFRLAA